MTDSESDSVCDAVTESSIPGTATHIMYCFFTGHIICAYICSIYHSSLLRYCLLCVAISTLSCEQVTPLIFRPPCCCLVITRSAQCDIAVAIYRIILSLSAIVIYRISLSLAGNELGNAETPGGGRITENKRSGGDVSDLICASEVRASAERTPLWPELTLAGPFGPADC